MGPDLMAEMRAQAERFGAEIIQGNVTAVDLLRAPVRRHDVGRRSTAPQTLIIATGASARLLGLPSERTLMGHGVSTCATCDGYFFRGKPIAVVGGGDSAMEEAIFLTRFASKVTVVHRRDTLRASKIMQDKALRQPEDRVRCWNTEVEDINDTAKGEVTGDGRCANTRPASEARCRSTACSSRSATRRTRRSSAASSRLDANGYIVTHDGAKTSVPGVFACGDVQDHIYRQAITAAGSGCMAAIDAEHYLDGLPEHLGEADGESNWNRVESRVASPIARFQFSSLSRSIRRRRPRRRRRTRRPVRA